jgi:hypothetical protein
MAYTTIDKPSDYFNTVLYTGNGSTQSITGVGFQPDWIWGKGRTLAGYNHGLADSVRGVSKLIYSNLTEAEETYSTGITSFDSDGFSVGSGNVFNNGSNTYVAWNWKAGTSFTNDASSTGIGTIDSAGSVNTDAGFSIVSYTGNGSAGATVAHGLGSAANLLIVKKRSSTAQWVFGSTALDSSWDNFLFLDATSAKGNADNVFNDTAPTSSVFSIGNAGDTNASGQTYICYAFAEKKGYSKFGSYTGNGNADGTFVYTGFKPAMVIIKRSSGVESWYTFDNKRDTSNVVSHGLVPNQNIAEFDADALDFTSNGFKIRTSAVNYNTSGDTYIYLAFAENPFVTSGGSPSPAR